MAARDEPSRLRVIPGLLLGALLTGGLVLGLQQAHASSAAPSPHAAVDVEAGALDGPGHPLWSGRAEAPRVSALSRGASRRVVDGVAAGFLARVELVVRTAEERGSRLHQGRIADRPRVSTCPAQGPPSAG